MPPTRAQQVPQAFLTRALDRTGLAWTRDCDGDPYTLIYGETPEEYLQVWFLLEGETCTIFQLWCQVQPSIPWKKLPEALIACNQYHEQYRFGRLYLQLADEPQAGATLHFEGQLDVTDGVSEAFLATFINSHLANACDFLAQVFKDKKLFGGRKPKSSRKRSAAGGKHHKHGKNSGK